MSSKYDLLKVKVRIDGEHYYILSRFQLSKMLTFCQVPTTKAVMISLELKKNVVDSGKTIITQDELESRLFSVMQKFGYGSERHTSLYPTMGRFYSKRIPLIVFIAGSGCPGSTTVAQMLSSKLNCHNVVNTDRMLDIVSAIGHTAHLWHPPGPQSHDPPFGAPSRVVPSSASRDGHDRAQKPFWCMDAPIEEVVARWNAEAQVVFESLQSDLEKTLTEGKVLLIEGPQLNLSLYQSYLSRETQRRYGAIVVGFCLSMLPGPLNRATEVFLSSRRHQLPPMPVAERVPWLTERIVRVHAEHTRSLHTSFTVVPLSYLAQDGDDSEAGTGASEVDAAAFGQSGFCRDEKTFSDAMNLPQDSAEASAAAERRSPCDAVGASVGVIGASAEATVLHAQYLSEQPSFTCTLLHSVILERIIAALHDGAVQASM